VSRFGFGPHVVRFLCAAVEEPIEYIPCLFWWDAMLWLSCCLRESNMLSF